MNSVMRHHFGLVVAIISSLSVSFPLLASGVHIHSPDEGEYYYREVEDVYVNAPVWWSEWPPESIDLYVDDQLEISIPTAEFVDTGLAEEEQPNSYRFRYWIDISKLSDGEHTVRLVAVFEEPSEQAEDGVTFFVGSQESGSDVCLDIARLPASPDETVPEEIEATEGSIAKIPDLTGDKSFSIVGIPDLGANPTIQPTHTFRLAIVGPPASVAGKVRILRNGVVFLSEFVTSVPITPSQFSATWTVEAVETGVVDIALIASLGGVETDRDQVRLNCIAVLPLTGRILPVNANNELDVSEGDAFDSVAAAITDASANSNIVVARGTYDENGLSVPSKTLIVGAAGKFNAAIMPTMFDLSALPTIDALNNGRIFDINGAAPGTGISALRLTRGRAPEGAGIRVSNSNGVCLTFLNLENNDAQSGNGGGVLLKQDTKVTLIRSSEFNSNTSGGTSGTGRGAGLAMNDSKDLDLEKTKFFENGAMGSGGGFSVEDSEDIAVMQSLFESNNTDQDGGGMHIEEAKTVTIKETDFECNEAEDGGGGLATFELDSSIDLEDCKFIKNESKGDDGGGGALVKAEPFSLNASTVRFKDCTFGGQEGDGNIAGDANATDNIDTSAVGLPFLFPATRNGGGGLSVIDSKAELTGGEISFNEAEDRGYGGGVGVTSNRATTGGITFVKFSDVDILNNKAAGGGGIAILPSGRDRHCLGGLEPLIDVQAGGEVRINDRCQIIDNESKIFGGGGIFASGETTVLTMNTGTILGNCTLKGAGNGGESDGGGATVCDGATATFNFVDFLGNDAYDDAGAINVSTDGTVTVNRGTHGANFSSHGEGGFAHVTCTGVLRVNQATIRNHISFRNGGAFDVRNAQVFLDRCTITGNDARFDGGGFRVFRDTGLVPAICLGLNPFDSKAVLEDEESTWTANTAQMIGGMGFLFSTDFLTTPGSQFRPRVKLTKSTATSNSGGKKIHGNSLSGFVIGQSAFGEILDSNFFRHLGAAVSSVDFVDQIKQDKGTFGFNTVGYLITESWRDIEIKDVIFSRNTLAHVRFERVFRAQINRVKLEQNDFLAVGSNNGVLFSSSRALNFTARNNNFFNFVVSANKFGVFVRSTPLKRSNGCPLELDFQQNWWGTGGAVFLPPKGKLKRKKICRSPSTTQIPAIGSQISEGVNPDNPSTSPNL